MLVDQGTFTGDGASTLRADFSSAFPVRPKWMLVMTDASAGGAAFYWFDTLPSGYALACLQAAGSARLRTGQVSRVEKGYFEVAGDLNVAARDYYYLVFCDDGQGREIITWTYDGELDNPVGYDVEGWTLRIPWTRGAGQLPAWGSIESPGTDAGLMFGQGLPLRGTGFFAQSIFNVNAFAFQGRFPGGIRIVQASSYLPNRRYCWAIAESDDESCFAFRPYTGNQTTPFVIPQTSPVPFTPTGFFSKLFRTGTQFNNCLEWVWHAEGVRLSRSGCGNEGVSGLTPVYGGFRVTSAINGISTSTDDGHGGITYMWRKTQ